jgi:uncharacterized membrane protein
MATTSNLVAPIAAPAASRLLSAPRLISVDLLRGLVMVIMALDHVRDFFTNLTFQPEDLSRTFPALFITRFVTHFCAPVFFLLAGTGASLAVARGKSLAAISRFLWTRGLWLVFLELTVMGFGWSFVLPFGFAGVIWALGWSMVAMAAIVRMPVRWIAALGAAMIAGHNLLDRITPDSFGRFSWLWQVLHSPGAVVLKPGVMFLILYPLVPWIGVMACGYALGWLLNQPENRRLVFRTGIGLTAAFLVLRGFNLYGNGMAGYPLSSGPWHAQPSGALTLISFLNTQKYPPSLDYLLMTLGPALIVLAWFGAVRAETGLARFLLVFGRVPMFYYVLHIYFIHLLAIVVAGLTHQPSGWLWHGGFFLQQTPAGYGHGLPFVYLMWAVTVGALYLPCEWYMRFKASHRDWNWLSYV